MFIPAWLPTELGTISLYECFYGDFMLPATINSTSSSHTVPDILAQF
jgi:hypothetical protein